MNEDRRVWIGCLAAYNAGHLHGEWFDATDDLGAAAHSVLASSPVADAEEPFIADHEGFPEGTVGEYTPLADVQELAERLDAIDHIPAEAVSAYIDNMGAAYVDSALDEIDEAYAGEWRSLAEYAENLADEIGAIDSDAGWPLSYIDWERAGRDLELGGDVSALDAPGGVYVFRNV